MCVNALLPWCLWCVGHWCVGPGSLEINLAWMILRTEGANVWKTTRKLQRLQFWKNPRLLVPLTHQMARNTSHCLVRPSGNPSSGQSWFFSFYRSLPVVQHPRFDNWLMFQIYSFTASFASWNNVSSSTAWKSALLNATCPYVTSPVACDLASRGTVLM